MNKKKKWKVEHLLSGIMALLGFAACSSNDEEPEIPSLYGVPSVTYRVIGSVTDEEGKPLENIQVILNDECANFYFDEENNVFGIDSTTWKAIPDTVYTDKNGGFSTHYVSSEIMQAIKIKFQDIDGEENGGEFETKELTQSDFEKKQLENGDGWFQGEYELSKKITLKKKNE